MDDNTANISFTVEHGDLHDIKPVVDRIVKELGGGTQAIYNSDLAKVSVVGVGMRTHTGVAQRMFKALADAQVNIQNITTSEIKISCIIDKEQGRQGAADRPRRVRARDSAERSRDRVQPVLDLDAGTVRRLVTAWLQTRVATVMRDTIACDAAARVTTCLSRSCGS